MNKYHMGDREESAYALPKSIININGNISLLVHPVVQLGYRIHLSSYGIGYTS